MANINMYIIYLHNMYIIKRFEISINITLLSIFINNHINIVMLLKKYFLTIYQYIIVNR